MRRHLGGLYARYIAAAEPLEIDRARERLLGACAPLIENTVRYKFGLGRRWSSSAASGAAEEEASDVIGDAYVAVLKWLQTPAEAGEPAAVEDFSRYLRTIVQNTFADWVRRQHPGRHRLKSRLLALASRDTPVSGFSTWETSSGANLFGFSAWQGREPRMNPRFSKWLTDPASIIQTGSQHPRELPLPALVARVLNWISSPISIDMLAAGLAELLGMKDEPALNILDAENELILSQPAPGVENRAVDHIHSQNLLRLLAEEVCLLPVNQAKAVLFALERGELVMLAATATPSRVAGLLGCPLEDLGRALEDVPLADLAIAHRLGVARQQVINLRKCARERLGRRLRARGGIP